MRLTKLILLLIVATVVSCQKDIEKPSVPTESAQKTVLIAQVEQPQTKSVIELGEGTALFKWVVGDEIAVMTDAGFKKFTVQADAEDENKILFESVEPAVTPIQGEGSGAIYPFAAAASDFATINLPASYGAVDEPYTANTNMPMLASISGETLSFKHLGGVALFTIEDVPADAAKFVFTANGKKITGDFELATEGENKVINTAATEASDDALTLNFQSFGSVQKSVTFYVPLPLGDYSGFTIQLQNSEGADLMHLSSAYAFTITRANVKVFSAVQFESDYTYNQGANSYFIPLNSEDKILINTKRVNAFWYSPNGGNEYANAIKAGTVWVPEVLWIEDVTGDITEADKANVSFYNSEDAPMAEFTGNVPFKVSINSATAKNILIAIKNKKTNAILWSWHLWVTDYNPNAATPQNGQVHSYNSESVMDRNLGALVTTYNGYEQLNPSTNKGIIGLYYQYGRKDPFKTQGTVDNTPGTKSYAYAVNNPSTFITGTDDWHSPTNRENGWNGNSGYKSIFDPCPEGWMLPTSFLWSDFTTAKTQWNNDAKGRVYHDIWYPASGVRVNTNSTVGDVQSGGYYWSLSLRSGNNTAWMLRFNNTNVHSGDNLYRPRAWGGNVRCIRD